MTIDIDKIIHYHRGLQTLLKRYITKKKKTTKIGKQKTVYEKMMNII